MPAGHGEARNIVFHSERAVAHRGLTREKEIMSRTIEAIMAHMAPLPKRQAAPAQTGQLIAEWQEGPKTISGYAPRKLRLVFARSPLDARQPA
jgi:hypothetical protein